MTLFFCLFLTLAFAATPSVGTIIPPSGASVVGFPKTFTCTYSDTDGWTNLKEAYLLISTSSTALNNSVYLYYDQNTNLLYLRNDANSAWLGGYSPGSSNVIENSYAKLNCAYTTISGSDTTLTVNWNIIFKSTFAGTRPKNTYLYVTDDSSAYSGWIQKGTCLVVIDSDNDGFTDQVELYLGTDPYRACGPNAWPPDFDNNGVVNILDILLFKPKISPNPYDKRYDLNTDGKVDILDVLLMKPYFGQTCRVDTTPPNISINPVASPTNQNVILSYVVTDNSTPSEEIKVTGDNSPYINEGNYNVTLTAEDKAGNRSTASISFTIDKTPPAVIITSPQNGVIVESAQIQLQGTVDGVVFSEPRTLIAGENTLTKIATDAAGNSASTFVTVYLYLGETIGPEGGEVLSADGKVKVVIPAGALSEPQQIKILNVNRETMQGAAPSGTSLLSVVECKPYGLVFNKPISIIYTLDQAEIPGTPVELGFYDAVQDKIISTGQTSTVPTDGYTVTFSVVHFSTYAALKNLTPQGTPIGGGVKIPLPDMFTGAFSHAIPISVAPGRKGIQPALGLTYRSSNSNSWVGLGFSLNPGYIVRSTRLGPPTYIDTQDTFYFVTDAGTIELVHLIDNLYQAKIESSFTKFFKEADDSWRVVGKDGGVLRFGQTSDSKEASAQGTFSWYLTKAVDNNGNYIEFNYTKDQGKSYLSRIDYTGNEMGISPTNSVEFFLEPRDDLSSSYISSAKIATVKRLKEIQVKVNYDLVWRYVLEYAYSLDTNRSLLRSITQYGSDNKSLPTQTLSYQQAK